MKVDYRIDKLRLAVQHANSAAILFQQLAPYQLTREQATISRLAQDQLSTSQRLLADIDFEDGKINP